MACMPGITFAAVVELLGPPRHLVSWHLLKLLLICCGPHKNMRQHKTTGTSIRNTSEIFDQLQQPNIYFFIQVLFPNCVLQNHSDRIIVARKHSHDECSWSGRFEKKTPQKKMCLKMRARDQPMQWPNRNICADQPATFPSGAGGWCFFGVSVAVLRFGM